MAKKEENKNPAKKVKISDNDLKKQTVSEGVKESTESKKKKISETREAEKKQVKAEKKAPSKGTSSKAGEAKSVPKTKKTTLKKAPSKGKTAQITSKTEEKKTSSVKKTTSTKKTSDKKLAKATTAIKLKERDKKTLETLKKVSLISEYDVHLFKEGKHFHLYKKLGSHIIDAAGFKGVYFALWAPNAREVSVIGDFNNWFKHANEMIPRQDESGIWELFVPEAKKGSIYKYFIRSNSGFEAEKGDPFAFMWEIPSNTASVVWDLENTWSDGAWMENRKKNTGKEKPVSAYELHIGSWKRVPEDGNRSLSYQEMALELPGYLNELGFTHVEFMPVMEHPFFGSWGYQVTGYFAPSSRFGTPQDFMHLIDALHQAGIGVILDWVPSHFPSDLHGLHYFDGTFLFEHEDPQKGFHPDWKSYIFNYGRNEVRAFLISNALFWLDKFHADGLRVDAVASMLYLDYSRNDGEWQPNEFGGNENLEAISFLKEFNEVVYDEFPDTITIAEESTAWPMVSKPTYMGGLGFGMKWMMGWMHDTLEYFQKDPVHRKHHQNTITFSTNYAFTENFMLPLSHDEVVYGKKALLSKMPGDRWNQFANLRTLYSYMFAH
ncbi:MAG: 1,4-alpha-glucan branching protein GlgB, partial [Gillisia sp.]